MCTRLQKKATASRNAPFTPAKMVTQAAEHKHLPHLTEGPEELDKDQGDPWSQWLFQHQAVKLLIQYLWHEEIKI